jgi:RNA polymerase primary sigma factor
MEACETVTQRTGEVLVGSHLPFVVKIAREYRRHGVPFEDLLSEGNLGLLEAARRFDAGRGARFTTYAAWWIRKFILQALRTQSGLVRLPDARRRAAGSRPAGRHVELRLDHRGGHGDRASLAEVLADPSCGCPEQRTVQRDLELRLVSALGGLSGPSQRVLQGRFGLSGDDPLTLKQVGEREGFSRERARQIENDALRRLRRELTRRAPRAS